MGHYGLSESYRKDGERTFLVEVLESDIQLLEQMAFASWAVRKVLNNRKNTWFGRPADELHLLLDDVGFDRILKEIEFGCSHIKKANSK